MPTTELNVIDIILQKLNALIFDIEQLKNNIRKSQYTIEIKDSDGVVIKNINTEI